MALAPKDSGQPPYPTHEQALDCPADQPIAVVFQIELETGLVKHTA